MKQRRWRYDVIPPWMEQTPRQWRVGHRSGPKLGESGQSKAIPYYGLDPKRDLPPVDGYGVLDEPSPPCRVCGVEAMCEDGICGACGSMPPRKAPPRKRLRIATGGRCTKNMPIKLGVVNRCKRRGMVLVDGKWLCYQHDPNTTWRHPSKKR